MRVIGLEELDQPFFARESTKDYIGRLSRCCDDLVVYTGAGVSIDRTGLSWSDLVAKLLTTHVGFAAGLESDLVGALEPFRAASIVSESLRAGLDAPDPSDDPGIRIAGSVRELVYKQGGSLHGQTSLALADLAIEALCSDRLFRVMTTNYDEYLVGDFNSQVEFWSSLLANRQDEVDGDTSEDLASRLAILNDLAESEAPVEFLHGRLPRDGAIQQDSLPVLSEADYLASSEEIFETLGDAFLRSNVLILGASVTDPPLVRALLKSRDTAEKKGLQRFAVLPRSDIGAEVPSSDSHKLLRAWQLRLSHLGVQGVFVDLLSQVAQLLREVAVGISEPNYGKSESRHGRRLQQWWTSWEKGKAGSDGFEVRQQADHEELVEALPVISNQLEADHEQLKVEVWLRWRPDKGNRELRLWASSFSRFTNPDQARTVSLAPSLLPPGSPTNSALEAFKLGRPYHMEDDSARWKSYLSAPIQISDDEVNLVVGSVVIASMKAASESHLGENVARARQAKALTIAQGAAEHIAIGSETAIAKSTEG